MAIDPLFYEKISGRRPNDAGYAGAILAASQSKDSLTFTEARRRGRRWLANGTGILVAAIAAVVLAILFISDTSATL